jgi:hypothetical protein
MTITLKPAEERLRDFLIERAARAAEPPATYAALMAEFDPDNSTGLNQVGSYYPRLSRALFHINVRELDHHRPMVGALAVVNTRSSISGFAGVGREQGLLDGDSPEEERRFWQDQREQAIKHWSDATTAAGDGGALSDDQFDQIMGELSKIKQMLRQILHG